MAESTAQLSILVKVRDEAAGALSRLSNETSSLGGQMNFLGDKAGMVAGALAALGSAAFLGSAVNQAREAAEGWLKMQTILEHTGVSAEEVRKRVEKMSQTSTFEAHEIGIAYAKNISLFGDTAKALEKTKLAMNLAAFAGIDLSTAQNMVSKASDESIMALKRIALQLGIVIPDFDKHMDQQKQFDAVLKIVTNALGNYDQKLLQSDGIRQVKKQWNEFLETVGTAILPTLNSLLKDYIVPLIQKIIEWANAHPALFKYIVLGIGIITALIAVLTPLVILFPAISVVIAALLSPVALIGAAMLALGAIIMKLSKDWETGWNNIMMVFFPQVYGLISAINSIKNAYNEVRNLLASPLNMVSNAIGNAGNWVNNKINDPFNDFISRPGMSPIAFSGEDTLIGMKNPGALAGAGGGNINIYLQGDMYTTTEVAEKFANEIARSIRYQIKL